MIPFSIPANFSYNSSFELKENLLLLSKVGVVEVYGNLNPSPLNLSSGRGSRYLPIINIEELKKYIEILSKFNIDFNYTINASCLGNREFDLVFEKEFIKFIKTLKKIGISRFTIALPSLLKYLDTISGINVTISTISNIISPSGVRYIEKFKCVDRLCVPEFFNRNLHLLKELKKNTKLLISTIVNSLCFLSCSFRNQHYNYNAHTNLNFKQKELYGILCDIERIDNPQYLLSSPWIRPDDIDLYINSGISMFKIAGREIYDANFRLMVENYQNKSYSGNLMKLLGCFGENPYIDLFHLNNKYLNEVMPKILNRIEGCHELLCKTCGICKSWTDRHKIINKNKIGVIEALKEKINEGNR